MSAALAIAVGVLLGLAITAVAGELALELRDGNWKVA